MSGIEDELSAADRQSLGKGRTDTRWVALIAAICMSADRIAGKLPGDWTLQTPLADYVELAEALFHEAEKGQPEPEDFLPGDDPRSPFQSSAPQRP